MAETHKELKISRAEAIIRYKFNNKDHIWEALQPRGSGINRIGTRITTAGNREVAIVGDAIMATVLSGQWLEANHPSARWSQARATILSNANLARVAFARKIDRALNYVSPTPIPKEKAADAVEAICGAVYRDGGESAVRDVMNHLGLNYEAYLLKAATQPHKAHDESQTQLQPQKPLTRKQRRRQRLAAAAPTIASPNAPTGPSEARVRHSKCAVTQASAPPLAPSHPLLAQNPQSVARNVQIGVATPRELRYRRRAALMAGQSEQASAVDAGPRGGDVEVIDLTGD